MEHNGWDHALKVTADGAGLVGHAGAVLQRKATDQQPGLALEGGVPHLLAPALHPARASLASTDHPSDTRRHSPARSEPVRTRAHRALPRDRTRQPNRHHIRDRSEHNQ
jgi:hypothetical protein